MTVAGMIGRAMAALVLFNTAFADSMFYFKGGGGLGYDSNVLMSADSYQSLFGNLSLAGQYEAGTESLKLTISANADSDIYDVFFYLGAGAAANLVYSIVPETQMSVGGQYFYLMDIRQAAGAWVEFAQDIAGFSTARAGYAFDASWGAAGVTNEQYLSHAVWVGWNFDLGSIGTCGVRIQDNFRNYPWIVHSGNELKHNGLTAGVELTILPDSVFEISAGGLYGYHDSFSTNLSVFNDTNDIALYNTASSWQADAGLKINWSSFWVTALTAQYDQTRLAFYPVTEANVRIGLSQECYLSDSVKLEFPVTYHYRNSSLSGATDRWLAKAEVYYLF